MGRPRKPRPQLTRAQEVLVIQRTAPAVRARLDAFVAEYCRDYNGTAAALRLGKPSASALDAASRWMAGRYFQIALRRRQAALEEKHAATQRRVMWGLWQEAHYHGPGSSSMARINALTALARILGLFRAEEAPHAGTTRRERPCCTAGGEPGGMEGDCRSAARRTGAVVAG